MPVSVLSINGGPEGGLKTRPAVPQPSLGSGTAGDQPSTGLTQGGLEGTPWQQGAEQAPSVAVLPEQLNNPLLFGATELIQVLR